MKKIKLILPLVVAVLCSGCATQYSWVYTPNKYDGATSISSKTAAVLPFKDGRANKNSNMVLMYLIPLVPYGSADYEIPEGAQMHVTSALWTNYKPVEDFPKALAEEFRNARFFKEAFFDFKKGESDIVINGTILSTKYTGKIISYGLSAYGPLLWLIGLPASSVTNELSLELACVDAKTNKVLFTKTYNADPYEKIGWIYSLPSDYNYPDMLQKVYKDFIADLKNVPGI